MSVLDRCGTAELEHAAANVYMGLGVALMGLGALLCLVVVWENLRGPYRR